MNLLQRVAKAEVSAPAFQAFKRSNDRLLVFLLVTSLVSFCLGQKTTLRQLRHAGPDTYHSGRQVAAEFATTCGEHCAMTSGITEVRRLSGKRLLRLQYIEAHYDEFDEETNGLLMRPNAAEVRIGHSDNQEGNVDMLVMVLTVKLPRMLKFRKPRNDEVDGCFVLEKNGSFYIVDESLVENESGGMESPDETDQSEPTQTEPAASGLSANSANEVEKKYSSPRWGRNPSQGDKPQFSLFIRVTLNIDSNTRSTIREALIVEQEFTVFEDEEPQRKLLLTYTGTQLGDVDEKTTSLDCDIQIPNEKEGPEEPGLETWLPKDEEILANITCDQFVGKKPLKKEVSGDGKLTSIWESV